MPTPSRREMLLQDVVARLGGAGLPAGVTVHRQRTLPLSQDQLPAMVVYLIQEQVSRSAGGLVRRAATIAVESRVDAGVDEPDAALDPLTTWAVQALCADPQLGGTVHSVTEHGTAWDASDDQAVLGAAKSLFVIDYTTRADDPTRKT